MGSVLLFFGVFRGKTKKNKKQNGRTYVPVSGMGSVLLFFWFFEVKPKKQKKTKWQNLCPSVWHGVSTFFLAFRGKTKKNKKNKMAEPMSQCLAWDQYFFCFFDFFCNILVSDMGSAILFCLCFFVFGEVFAIFWCLTWVLPFCFFSFSRFFAIFGLSQKDFSLLS